MNCELRIEISICGRSEHCLFPASSKWVLDSTSGSNPLLNFHDFWRRELSYCTLYGLQKLSQTSTNINFHLGSVWRSRTWALVSKIRRFLVVILMCFKLKNCPTSVQFFGPFSIFLNFSLVKRWKYEKKSNQCKKPHSNRPNPN